MDDIWFNRLMAYVKKGLADAEVSIDNLSKIALLVMEFVDSFQNSATTAMDSIEKHNLAMGWIERIVSTYCNNKKLTPEVKQLLSEFMSRICEVSKGQTTLNSADKVLATSKPPSKLVVSPTVVSDATPNSPTGVTTDEKKKKKFWKG